MYTFAVMALFKQDDIVEIDVTGYGASGEGVAKCENYVFFIPFAAVGERVRAKIIHVNKKNLVFCELKEVLVPSDKRVKPVCNRFTRCGGCDLMHLRYDEQLKIKKDNLIALLRKNAGLSVEVDDVVPCSAPLGYRNKIQLPFGVVNGEIAMGFFRENSHKIVSVTKCFLHGEWVETLIKVFLDFAKNHALTAYEDGKKSGLLRHMVARKIGEEFCLVVVTNEKKLPFEKDLVERLTDAIGEKFALYNSVKTEHDNVILGKTLFPIKERKTETEILGVKVEINPFSFLQLNDEIRDKIYLRIIDEIGEKCVRPIVIDAYAGVGTLGAVMAKRGAKVYNVEIVKEATADGDALAKKNGLVDSIVNINGDAAIEVPLLIEKLKKNKVLSNELTENTTNRSLNIILDPPRKGCDERVLRAIGGIKTAHTLYYISCNPATLTRDLKILAESGYEINYVTPYDMFPQTKHVETLVRMEK